MCPFFITSKRQDLCTCYFNGLYCPSLKTRNKYCFSNYFNCRYYQERPAPADDFSGDLDACEHKKI